MSRAIEARTGTAAEAGRGTPETAAEAGRGTARLVGLGVAGGFLLLALAWTALFIAAGRTRTQFIPVERTGSHR